MRVNSKAWLYSEESLRRMRNGVYFAPIAYKYKYQIRNMIKLLAMHGIHSCEEGGEWVNTKRKTKAARERVERPTLTYQSVIARLRRRS